MINFLFLTIVIIFIYLMTVEFWRFREYLHKTKVIASILTFILIFSLLMYFSAEILIIVVDSPFSWIMFILTVAFIIVLTFTIGFWFKKNIKNYIKHQVAEKYLKKLFISGITISILISVLLINFFN